MTKELLQHNVGLITMASPSGSEKDGVNRRTEETTLITDQENHRFETA
jgi:hypothetical protein